MESTYRTWLHAMKDKTGSWNMDELRRDLQTTLGTAKWQVVIHKYLYFYTLTL